MIVQPFHLANPLGHKATLVLLYLAIFSDLTLQAGLSTKDGLAFRVLHLYPYAAIDLTVHFSL